RLVACEKKWNWLSTFFNFADVYSRGRNSVSGSSVPRRPGTLSTFSSGRQFLKTTQATMLCQPAPTDWRWASVCLCIKFSLLKWGNTYVSTLLNTLIKYGPGRRKTDSAVNRQDSERQNVRAISRR